MAVSKELKAAVLSELQKSNPLMDLDAVRGEFLEWLAALKFPGMSEGNAWEKQLKAFPATVEEAGLTTGRRIRLALSLRTKGNRYVITITETLDLPGRGVYVLALFNDWQHVERQKIQTLEQQYLGEFDDRLRAKHTLWAQTFRAGELRDALNSCAMAILGNELTEKQDPELETAPVEKRPGGVAHFPVKSDD